MAIGIAILVALVASIVVTAATLSVQDIGDDDVAILHNTFSIDASATISGELIVINPATESAIGDTSASAVEATTSSPIIQSSLTADNYAYSFLVDEVSGTCPNCWSSGDQLRVQVWGLDTDGSPDTVNLTGGGDGGLYIKQLSEDAAVEGFQVIVDLGTVETKYDSFDVLIDRY